MNAHHCEEINVSDETSKIFTKRQNYHKDEKEKNKTETLEV